MRGIRGLGGGRNVLASSLRLAPTRWTGTARDPSSTDSPGEVRTSCQVPPKTKGQCKGGICRNRQRKAGDRRAFSRRWLTGIRQAPFLQIIHSPVLALS